MYIDIIIFAIIAGVLGANLYKLLGKRTRVENDVQDDDKVSGRQSRFDESLEGSEKSILEVEKNFSEDTFLDGAKKAFKIIVSSYKDKNIYAVKELLSEKVFESFQEQSELQDLKYSSFQIKELKASVLNIEVVREIAKIKVLFESTQESILEKKVDLQKIRDVWMFEKEVGIDNPNWILAEVISE